MDLFCDRNTRDSFGGVAPGQHDVRMGDAVISSWRALQKTIRWAMVKMVKLTCLTVLPVINQLYFGRWRKGAHYLWNKRR